VHTRARHVRAAVSAWLLLAVASMASAQAAAQSWLEAALLAHSRLAPKAAARVVPPRPASSSQQLLACLLDERVSHEDRLARIKDMAGADEGCWERVNTLVSSTGVTAGAVTQLVAAGLARGLSPKAIEKVVYRMASSEVDADTALRQAFATMFMACEPLEPGYRSA